MEANQAACYLTLLFPSVTCKKAHKHEQAENISKLILDKIIGALVTLIQI